MISSSTSGMSSSSSSSSSAFESVLVAVRVRRVIQEEEDKGKREAQWEWKGNQIWASPSSSSSVVDSASSSSRRVFSVDRLFGPSDDNRSVHSSVVAPIISGVVQGYNATVFAYGQSSSGKTHTMLGDEADPGVMRRAVEQIFRHFEEECEQRAVQFLIRVSYLEIYQERLKDLLLDPAEHPSPPRLAIQEDRDGNSVIANLTEVPVQCPEDIFTLLEMGERFRHYGVTNVNRHSSRSHAIFRLIVESSATETATLDASEY